METEKNLVVGGRLDVAYIEAHVSDIGKLLELCPNPTCEEIGKLLAVQAAVLQREGLGMLASAAELPGLARVKRLAIGVDLLRAAESSFARADKILSRRERVEDKLRVAVEARRIANAELLERALESGLYIEAHETETGVEVDVVSVLNGLRGDLRFRS